VTLSGPIALGTLGYFAAALGGLLVVAYILKLRRRRFEVPFSKLWQRVLRDKESSSLWHRLRRLFSLMIQLALLALLVFAATDPRLGQASTSARSVVIIVDASASMKTQDGGPSAPARIERAKAEARGLLMRMGGADVAMIVRMDGQSTALSRFEADTPRLLKVVDGIAASDTPADLPRALQAAADALRGRKNPLIVIIGDGAYRDEQRDEVVEEAPPEAAGAAGAAPGLDRSLLGKVDLSGVEVAFIPVGEAERNVGIVAFNVRRYFQNKMSYEVLVEIMNFGDEPKTLQFTLASGGNPIDVKEITIGAGERVRKIYPDLGGGDDRQLTATIKPLTGPGGQLEPADPFPLDDVAYALLPERKKQRVLLVSEDNLYLEGALLLDPNISVTKIKPAEYPTQLAAGSVHGFDVVVLDGYTPDKAPPAPASIYFGPRGEHSPVAIRSEIKRPFITDTERDHPVMRWVTLSDVNIDASAIFAPAAGDAVLARSIRDPILVAGKREGKKFVAFGFGLGGTDLMLRVAFPVLIINSMDWFAGDDAELISTFRTGRVWHIPVEADEGARMITVLDPRRKEMTAPVVDGRAELYGQQVGIYKLRAGDEQVQVAANLADPSESKIAPIAELTLGGRTLGEPPSFTASITRAIWVWLLLAALAILLVEWLTYNRRITV
jgi:hypothetical protein